MYFGNRNSEIPYIIYTSCAAVPSALTNMISGFVPYIGSTEIYVKSVVTFSSVVLH